MDSSPSVELATLAFNSAASGGGGILIDGVSSPSFTGVITAFNSGAGGIHVAFPFATPAFACCDTYGNQGDEYAGFVTDPTESDGNVSVDPHLCADAADLQDCSPFVDGAPCGPIGARGPACKCDQVAVDAVGWGRIKAHYLDPDGPR
jgi:hypothetical protein